MSPALKALAQLTMNAGIGYMLGNHELRFTFSAETFLAALHRSIARWYCHGAKHDAGVTALAEFRTHPKREIHSPIFSPAHKANGIRLPHLGTDANAPAAKNAVLIPEGIADFFDSTTYGNVLDSPGVWGLGNEQLGNVSPQSPDFFTVAPDHHPFFHTKSARGGDFRPAVLYMFDNAQPTGANIGKAGNMAQVGDTDSVFNGCIKHACPSRSTHVGTINDHSYILYHGTPLYLTEIASNLHSYAQMPHLPHREVSMLWGCFFSPSIASLGQFRLQTPQPLHFSVSTA
jgi:hypothetical protein